MQVIRKKTVDFTTGNIVKNFIVFAIPLIAGELFQNLYHSTDSIVLGNFTGETALAAVSVCGNLTNLLVGFCNGMSVGNTVSVGKAFGSHDRQKLEEAVCYTYTFACILGLVVSVIGFAAAPFLVRIVSSGEIYSDALLYLRIYIVGLIFTVVYNNSAGILRGMGDMKTPFTVLLVSCSSNIVLDLLFSAILDLGIAGVATATVISQIVSVSISYYVITKKFGFKCFDLKRTLKHGKEVIFETLDVGIGAGLQTSMVSFSNLFVWRYVDMFGTTAIAGVGIAHRVDKFVSLPNGAFGSSITAFTSQNLGAHNYERIKEGIRKCLLLAVAVEFVFLLVLYPNAGLLASAFNRNSDVLTIAVDMIHVMMPLYMINAIRQVITGVLRANKRSTSTSMLNLIGMIGARQLYLFVSMRKAKVVTNIYWCYPAGWIVSLVLILIYYIAVHSKLNKPQEK